MLGGGFVVPHPLERVGIVKSLLSDGTEKNLRTKGNFLSSILDEMEN